MSYPRFVHKYVNNETESLLVNDVLEYNDALTLGWYATVPLAIAAAPSGSATVKNLVQLLTDATAAVTGSPFSFSPPSPNPFRHVKASVTGTDPSGAVTAEINIQRSDLEYEGGWGTEYTACLDGTGSDIYSGTQADNGGVYRAVLTTVTGTNAKVSVWFEE